jgi:hypothetical protein
MITWLKNSIVPTAIILILSTCFILGGYLYQTVYQPLLTDGSTQITASDFAVPTAKLNSTKAALDARTQRKVDFSTVPNTFRLAE